MKKILLNESERKAVILDREKAIVENFAKTFNKIKRIDENEVGGVETKELEKKAFDFANSPEMGQLVDKILDKSKPEDLQKIKTAVSSVSESMMYESDFSSFLNIAHKAQSTLSEDNSVGDLQNSVGKALQNFGVANIMSMGMLPAVVSIAVDYLGGPNLLQAVGDAVGTGGGGTAALSVVASLIGGALLWRLGKSVSGEKVTGDTPLFEMDGDGEDYEAASRGVEYGINLYEELSSEEQEILDDILNGTINEGLGSMLQKIKQYASKGILTAAIMAALLATPNITSAQQSQIKQAASIENTQGMDTGISKMDNMALFNKVVNLIKQSPEKAAEWVKKGDNGNSMIGTIIKIQNMQQQNHKDGKTFGGYLKNDKNSAATEGFLSFMTTQTGNAQIGGMNFR